MDAREQRDLLLGRGAKLMQLVLIVALSLVGCAPCGLQSETLEGDPPRVAGAPILIEITEWTDVDAVFAVDAEGATHEVRRATAGEIRVLEEHRDRSIQRSVEAFDALRRATENAEPRGDYARDYGRENLLMVPNPAGTVAVLMALYPRIDGLFDLRTGERLPTPPELGSVLFGPVAWCRNGELVALRAAETSGGEASRLVVLDVTDRRVVLDLLLGSSVQDVAWNESCDELAVVMSESRWGKGPLESFYARIGHPVPYDDFSLIRIGLDGSTRAALPIASDVRYGGASLMWDAESESALAQLAQGGIVSSKGR